MHLQLVHSTTHASEDTGNRISECTAKPQLGKIKGSRRGLNMSNKDQGTDLLLAFEAQNIPKAYLPYYEARRQNFFASIQGFPNLWKMFMALDAIWLREFDDLKPVTDPNRLFPIMVYVSAHAKIRLAMELAFSACLGEARSILRDAIESVAHAHVMLGDPKLQKVWLSKDDGKTEEKAFTEAFLKNKADRLFKGLKELHEKFGELSETGSHTTLMSMVGRLSFETDSTGMSFNLNYTGTEPAMLEKSIFMLLLTCFVIEDTFNRDYEDRLKLDITLVKMRKEFAELKEQLRKEIIIKHKIQPPPISLRKP